MQLSQILALAFATTAMAKVYTDNVAVPASVEGPSNSVPIEADVFGTAVTAPSAKLRPKALQARDSKMTTSEHHNITGACRTVTGINAGTCCKSLYPGHSKRYLIRENRQYQRYLERCHLVH
jgi:hypothetical protein